MSKPSGSGRSSGADRKRLIILAYKSKPQVVEALKVFRPWLEQRADVVGEWDTRGLNRDNASELPEADLAVVLGGDGTMLAQARALIDRDLQLLGINFGKLGFLAEFTIDSVKANWESIVSGSCRTSRRMMLEVLVYPPGAPEWGDSPASMPPAVFQSVVMNDAVITAGPPYRMVEIELAIEPGESQSSATTFIGDGVVVATPSGSTAYNLAAGGPIVSPGVNGMCITAICPYSLAARPIVAHASSEIWLGIRRANEGTELVLDGQDTCQLVKQQQVLIKQHSQRVHLLHNPDYHYWNMLAHKMHWAARPQRG